MNLTALFEKDAAIKDVNTARNAAIVDHRWMKDGIIHDGKPQLDISHVKNPNNTKPQLEVEWGGAGPEIDLDEPAGKVTRTIPEEAQGDAGGVILFARDLMNRGTPGHKVIAALKSRFGVSVLRRERVGLEDLFKMDGVIGRFALDARGYKSCKDALKAASQSPYKRFIKQVIGCECGSPHLVAARPSGGLLMAESKSTGNPMDDFLASEKAAEPTMVAHCRETMLPRVSSVGDLDKSELNDTLVEMMNVTGLPAGVADGIAVKRGSNVAKLAMAFRWLDRQAEKKEAGDYSGKVDASEFKLKKADNELDLIGIPQSDIDVDPVMEPQEVDLVEDIPMSTEVVPMRDSVDFDFEMPQPDFPDVDMGQAMDPEFEGTDEVVLDEPGTLMDEISVNMLPEPDVEDERLFAKDEKSGQS